MSSNKMNIPKKIHVGYQKRGGTYTGKLAYVTYTDHKGVHRKKHSWDTWRDDKIPVDDFDNEPMSGFVLNKGVGGARQSWGWNARNEYIRVYDPRNFEIEISVANLLFILQESSSIKGKGLEGEFVYSWDSKELVLLPTSSHTYQECVKYTNFQSEKLSKADMVLGCSYLLKNMTNVMYLGRQEWYEHDSWSRGNVVESNLKGKKHVYLNLDVKKGSEYILDTGYTKLAKKTSNEPLPNFAEEYDKFKKSLHNNPMTDLKLIKEADVLNRVKERGYMRNYLLKEGDSYKIVGVSPSSKKEVSIYYYSEGFVPKLIKTEVRGKMSCLLPYTKRSGWGYSYRTDHYTISDEKFNNLELFNIYLVSAAGGTKKIHL